MANKVGVLGATSLVGRCLLALLAESDKKVIAYSRQTIEPSNNDVEWRQLTSPVAKDAIPGWICVAPIWLLPDYFSLLEAQGARRVVALSSTSLYTKHDSFDPAEQAVALKLADAEARVHVWANRCGIEWVILRPTLIYGRGEDKNIAEIARLIDRLGFFPLFGQAQGLRQPVHADDVAKACLSALQTPCAANQAYTLCGAETLSYRAMVTRIFIAQNRKPRLLTVPLWAFRLALRGLRCLPRYRQWSTAMAERMNRDLVFDYRDAERDLGFKPRALVLDGLELSHRT